LPPSSARGVSLFANLTPAPGRRTQTISPYASGCARQSQPSRPPLPAPTSATMAYAPPVGQDGGSYGFDLPDGATGIFLREGLDRVWVICPSGYFVAGGSGRLCLGGRWNQSRQRGAVSANPHGEEARSAVSNHVAVAILRDAAESVIGRAFARPVGGSSSNNGEAVVWG
jgi:hypothetical protein